MYLFFVLSLFLNVSLGETLPKCKSMASSMEFYNCILENHPQYKSAVLSYDIAKAARNKITSWPNPEVSIKSISGNNAGENVGSTEIVVGLDLTELLVKRLALSKSGRSEEKLLTVVAQEEEFLAKVQIIKDLYRYRQILEELELTNEVLVTFEKISNQYRSRKARGPEQEITLSLVGLAQGDYQLRKNHLSVEKSEIETQFKGVFGKSFEIKKEWLPKLKTQWPEIHNNQISKNTFELRKAEANKEVSEAAKSIANAESWPKISAGPVFERNTEGPTQYNSAGFNLNVTLPIFSINSNARELAGKSLLKAKFEHDYALKKADLEKELVILKYSSAVESLKKSNGSESLKKNHNQIDNFFRRGLTSGGTIIEAHRQILEFTESQHEHELTALQALMYLNLLAGKDIAEVLK